MARLAVIGCDLKEEPRYFRGKELTVTDITKLRLKEISQMLKFDIEVNTYRPIDNPDNFPKAGEYDGIIIGGSTLDINDRGIRKYPWMGRLLEFITQTHGKIPLLGLCFGHQAIGRAFGSSLETLSIPEEGFIPLRLTEEGKLDPLFKSVPERFDALLSHNSYLADAPQGSVILARGAGPSTQAFRIGESTWGLQFHPEFTPETERRILEANKAKLEHIIDFEAALKSTERPDEKRDDTKTLSNFVRFISEKSA
jgi:GMP synthase-like glutamine amidotransferase